MGEVSREEKIYSIQKQLKALLCFSIEESLEYISNIEKFPDAGLDAFLEFLANAKAEQDKFFTETLKRNPEFAQEFSKFLNKTSTNIKDQFEAKQHGDAEIILNDFP